MPSFLWYFFSSALLLALLILDSSHLSPFFGPAGFLLPLRPDRSQSPSSFRLAFYHSPLYFTLPHWLRWCPSVAYPSSRLEHLELHILLSAAACSLPLPQASPCIPSTPSKSTSDREFILPPLSRVPPSPDHVRLFRTSIPPRFSPHLPRTHLLFTSFIVSLGVGRQGVVFLAGR
jgi:hypothetical protein